MLVVRYLLDAERLLDSGTDAIASTTWLSSGTELKAGAVKLADGANGVRTNGALSVASQKTETCFLESFLTKRQQLQITEESK